MSLPLWLDPFQRIREALHTAEARQMLPTGRVISRLTSREPQKSGKLKLECRKQVP